MGRVISYEEKTGISDGDYLLLDNGNGGTKRIRADRVGPQVDSVPIEGSTHAVSSGGVKSAYPNANMSVYGWNNEIRE